MDKTRNLKRGAKKQQSERHKKFFGVFGVSAIQSSEKSNKGEKVRSLISVTTSISEMGCHVSQKQHDPKRFKIPKNFLNGCNGVCLASVPRKLRSATKKRSRESILLDSEKANHKIIGIESTKKDNVKKSKKQGIFQNWSQREEVSVSITKDEEEVAETLYALAGMFPQSGSNHICKKLDGESLIQNSSVLQNMKENANAAIEASVTGQGGTLCPESCLHGEASKITSINETIGQEQSERAKLLVASHSTTPTINLQTMPGIVKLEFCNKVALHDSELCLAMGLNMTGQSRISQCERKPDVELEADKKQKQHLINEKGKVESLALWPGLSLDLMETLTCSSSRKISEPVTTHKRSQKRCATHVYISHTIQTLEVPKQGVFKESKLHECYKEGSKCGVLFEVHNSNRIRNGVTTARNPNESKNGILLQQSQAAPTPALYGPQKQTFNFLSLSIGSYGLKVDNNNHNEVGNRLEPFSKLQVPYFHSLAQQQRVMPIPTPQSRNVSTVYLDQRTVVGPQLRLQQPHYYGSQLCGTQYSSPVSNSKQEHQNFWEMQQAAQGRSSVNCNTVRTQNPNWQIGRNDSSTVGPCAQAIFPHTSASQEIFGSKITPISGRQQQLVSPIHDKWARSSSQFYM